jgi:pyruvate dehydrogenase E1 component
VLDRVFRRVPLVTVPDGHPHTLSFLGATLNVPSVNLGVSMFGQGGSLHEIYRLHGLDPDSIISAALDLIDA